MTILTITIELNGKKFETKPKDAIKEGKIQKHIKNTGMSQ